MLSSLSTSVALLRSSAARRVAARGVSGMSLAAAVRGSVPAASAVRHMSAAAADGSHPDFEAQRKVPDDDPAAAREVIDKAVKDNKIMLFMKGTPEAPQCGFSMQVVRILHAQGVDFASANVLEHPGIREGIKEYSSWPTIPQLYINGEFVGGCDIVTTMHQNGDLEDMLKE